MKKVTSIFAVALMTLGLTTYAIENSANEFDATQTENSITDCDDCSQERDDRKEDTLS